MGLLLFDFAGWRRTSLYSLKLWKEERKREKHDILLVSFILERSSGHGFRVSETKLNPEVSLCILRRQVGTDVGIRILAQRANRY
jgi:hypothetical protein